MVQAQELLSSKLTVFYRGFYCLFFGFGCLLTLTEVFFTWGSSAESLAFFVALVLLAYFTSPILTWREVLLCGDQLVVGWYSKVDQIPISQIVYAKTIPFPGYELVEVGFREESKFGKKIVFLAGIHDNAVGPSYSKVTRLKELIKSVRDRD